MPDGSIALALAVTINHNLIELLPQFFIRLINSYKFIKSYIRKSDEDGTN